MEPTEPGAELDVDELCILSGLLSPPTQETIDALEEMSSVWNWLAGAIQEVRGIGLPGLRSEYQRLMTSTQCPPWESHWSPEILGGSPQRLVVLYNQAGIGLRGHEPDSIVMQLIYAAWYLEQDFHNAPAGWRQLWEHLSSWVPKFARCLQSRARIELYRLIGVRLEALFTMPNPALH